MPRENSRLEKELEQLLEVKNLQLDKIEVSPKPSSALVPIENMSLEEMEIAHPIYFEEIPEEDREARLIRYYSLQNDMLRGILQNKISNPENTSIFAPEQPMNNIAQTTPEKDKKKYRPLQVVIALLGMSIICGGSAIVAHRFQVFKGMLDIYSNLLAHPTPTLIAEATEEIPTMTPSHSPTPLSSTSIEPTPTLGTEPSLNENPKTYYFENAPSDHDDDAEAIGSSTFFTFLLDNGQTFAVRNKSGIRTVFPAGTSPILVINERDGKMLCIKIDTNIKGGELTISKPKDNLDSPANILVGEESNPNNVDQYYSWERCDSDNFPFEHQAWYNELLLLMRARSLELPEAQLDSGVPVIDTTNN